MWILEWILAGENYLNSMQKQQHMMDLQTHVSHSICYWDSIWEYRIIPCDPFQIENLLFKPFTCAEPIQFMIDQ